MRYIIHIFSKYDKLQDMLTQVIFLINDLHLFLTSFTLSTVPIRRKHKHLTGCYESQLPIFGKQKQCDNTMPLFLIWKRNIYLRI